MGDTYTDGEYYMNERSPDEISELREHNRRQDELIQETRDLARGLYNGLYGLDGKNGLRREFRAYQDESREELRLLNDKIDKLFPKIIATVSTIVAIIVGLNAFLG